MACVTQVRSLSLRSTARLAMKRVKRLPRQFNCLLLVAALLSTVRPAHAQSKQAFDLARERMVQQEIITTGIKNKRVIEAMRITPRHEFVLPPDVANAYYDMSLPIGEKQTISAPFVV